MRTRILATAVVLAGGLALSACLVKPPAFEQAPDRSPEVRMLPPGPQYPAGGATIRFWAHVTNPNSVGLTLRDLQAKLLLDGTRAASGDLPLGVTIEPGADTVVPLDLSVDFAVVPAIGDVMRRAATGQAVNYQLVGTVGIDAGGRQPTYGPMTLLAGRIEASALTGLRGNVMP